MKKVILTNAPSGYNVQVMTDDSLELIWPSEADGGFLQDAIITAASTAEEISADNAQAWKDLAASYDTDDGNAIECESCLEYQWGFDPAESPYKIVSK